jgi:RNA polymerase sigma factor (sigma-70 family)
MAIERLRPDERELIHLIYYRGLTLVEAANHLEKKLGTLKSTLSRTLAKLRLILDPQDF